VLGATGSRSDGWERRERSAHQARVLVIAGVEVRGSRVNTGNILDLSRAGEHVDKVQKDVVIS
jgi:hypothetical protein